MTEINSTNTLYQQYLQVYKDNKDLIVRFNDCDFNDVLDIITEELNKYCLPELLFNYLENTKTLKHVRYSDV